MKSYRQFLEVATIVAVTLNSVMLIHNIVNEQHDIAKLNFLCGLVLLFGYETIRE